MGYGRWLHGEAVGSGMVLASELSMSLGGLDAAQCSRIRELVRRAGLPTSPPAWPAEEFLRLMAHDKKTASGRIRYVVLRNMGHAELQHVADALVIDAIRKTIASEADSRA